MTRLVPSTKSSHLPQGSNSSSTDFRDDSANLSSEARSAAVRTSTMPSAPSAARGQAPPAVVPARHVKLRRHLQPQDGLKLAVLQAQPSNSGTARFPAILMTHRLTQGSFGKFHVGIDGTGAAFAVKQVRFEARADLDRAKNKQGRLLYTAVHDFHREATFLRAYSTSLSLRGLYATDDYRGFLVTDLMAGDLDGCMLFFQRYLTPRPREDRGQRPEDQSHLVSRLAIAARVMQDIALEMSRLVEAGVGHQDIKGSNLLVSVAPHRIVLADYGFASSLRADGMAEHTHIGTYAYANPEVMLGMHYRTSGDMWSLGATLIEVLTGKTFFDVDQQDRSEDSDDDCHSAVLRLHERYRSWHCILDTIDVSLDDDIPSCHYSEDRFFAHMSEIYLAMRPFRRIRAFIYRQMMHPYACLRSSFAQASAFAADLLEQRDLLGTSLAEHAERAIGSYAARKSRASQAVAQLSSIRERVFTPDGGEVAVGVLAEEMSPGGAGTGRSSRRTMRPPVRSYLRREPA